MRPLLYLFWRRTVNSLKRAVKTPRLLVPAILVLLLLATQLIGYFVAEERGSAGSAPAFTRTDLLMGGPGAFIVAVRGVLLLSLFSSFLTALGEGNLFFAQSDVDFLFPAPLRKRSVLLFKMLARYVGLLFPAVYLPLALGNAALTSGNIVSPFALWPGMLGSWLYLTAATNVAQIILLNRGAGDEEEDSPSARRRAVLRRVFVGLISATIALGVYFSVQWLSGRNIVLVAEFLRFVNSETVNRVLLPDAWAAELFHVAFAGWRGSDLLRLAGLILLAGASFVWLFARDRDFYESAIEVSAKRDRMTHAMRSGDAGTILSQLAKEGKLARGRSVRTLGGGARAVLWKDLVSVTRTPPRSYIQLAILAAFPAIFGGIFGRRGDVNVVFWAVMFSMQMASFFLLALRDMLRRADISKALPIAPSKLLVAELLLSVVQLTALGWFSLGLMVLTGMGRGPLVVTAALALPSLAALLLLVQTTFVLLYPNPNDPAQHTISGVLSLMASLFSLTPTLLIGIVLFQLGVTSWLLALALTAVNLVTAGIALAVATYLWQRFDPTD
jgi:ABC-2 type transport system permease protein